MSSLNEAEVEEHVRAWLGKALGRDPKTRLPPEVTLLEMPGDDHRLALATVYKMRPRKPGDRETCWEITAECCEHSDCGVERIDVHLFSLLRGEDGWRFAAHFHEPAPVPSVGPCTVEVIDKLQDLTRDCVPELLLTIKARSAILCDGALFNTNFLVLEPGRDFFDLQFRLEGGADKFRPETLACKKLGQKLPPSARLEVQGCDDPGGDCALVVKRDSPRCCLPDGCTSAKECDKKQGKGRWYFKGCEHKTEERHIWSADRHRWQIDRGGEK
jgi:hypothetical protein